MFYGHIYTIVTVHSIKDCHVSKSTVTSFLRNNPDEAINVEVSLVVNLDCK